ncbi:MAG: helix-turn-helix transcriptional regulator [Caulobacter sp.]
MPKGQTSRLPVDVDIHVGSRVRLQRKLRGLSQTNLGQVIGLTFQQVQKYERGASRISAAKLYRLAQALDVSVSWFFDGLPGNTEAAPVAPEKMSFDALMATDEGPRLLATFQRIDPQARKKLVALVEAMAAD